MEISGKNYRLEYTVEAALCDECVERTMRLFVAIGEAQNEQDIKKVVSTMTDIPRTALYLFYGGLLEHHADEVKSVDDAKKLVTEYFRENKDSEDANFYGLLTTCLTQMKEDGFFRQIGLEQAVNQTEEMEQKTIPMNRQQRRAKASAK
jgi:hypothetical protein